MKHLKRADNSHVRGCEMQSGIVIIAMYLKEQ